MLPHAQLLAVAFAPAAIAKMGPRTRALLLVYLVLTAIILGVVGWVIAGNREAFLDWLATYLLPESLRSVGAYFVERYLTAQVRAVIVNATISGSLALVSALLFPLKEKISAVFEVEGRLTDRRGQELPLYLQALEELKLILLFVTAQGAIFWIGYSPDPTRRAVATVLSHAYLFWAFTIDFLAPLWQRHGLRYATIHKALLSRPLLLAFGACFTLPAMLIGRVADARPEWDLGWTLAPILAVNAVCIAWGVIAGAWLSARTLAAVQATTPPAQRTRRVTTAVVGVLLAANAYAYGSVALALQQKSQLLKCRWSVDPWSISLMGDPPLSGVAMTLTIENPTPHDVVLERNRVDVKHQGTLVAQTTLTPFRVAAGGQTTQRVQLPLVVDAGLWRRGLGLLDVSQWEATVYLRVAPGFDFPVYLLTRERAARD